MTTSGQSRRFDAPPTTSGLPQSTDIGRLARLVRFVPARDSCTAANKRTYSITSSAQASAACLFLTQSGYRALPRSDVMEQSSMEYTFENLEVGAARIPLVTVCGAR
jgi:hypothetical protein